MRNERIIALVWLVTLFLILGVFLQNKLSEQAEKVNNPATGNAVSSGVKVSYTNLEKELSKNIVIQALPSEAVILLKFYNFNSGERTWEKSYIIKKGEAKETTNLNEEADIVLSLHSKYLQELTSENFCEVIQKSNKNGDLGFDTELSSIVLAWKFKSVYKYKDCLGI